MRSVLDLLGRRTAGGALVAIVAEVPEVELPAVTRLRTRFGSVLIVKFDRSTWDASAPAAPDSGDGQIIRVTSRTPFPEAWNTALRRRSGRRPTVSMAGRWAR
jgi:hypothetical protein